MIAFIRVSLAGCEATYSTILTDLAVPTSYRISYYSERGWSWWYFSRIEFCDEKMVLSADYPSVGMFKVIPEMASEFYFLDVRGSWARRVFKIER